MKTSELTGAALDWAVAKCAHIPLRHYSKKYGCIVSHNCEDDVPVTPGYEYSPSTNWSQGGPIIERERMLVKCGGSVWVSYDYGQGFFGQGPTPLIAAMRCFCSARLGDIVDVPEELCQQQSS